MSSAAPGPGPETESLYWRARVFVETRAALTCKDARTAAIHVELATHCLRMAQSACPAAPVLKAAEEA